MPPRSRKSAIAVLAALGKRMLGKPLAVAISSGLSPIIQSSTSRTSSSTISSAEPSVMLPSASTDRTRRMYGEVSAVSAKR